MVLTGSYLSRHGAAHNSSEEKRTPVFQQQGQHAPHSVLRDAIPNTFPLLDELTLVTPPGLLGKTTLSIPDTCSFKRDRKTLDYEPNRKENVFNKDKCVQDDTGAGTRRKAL